MDNPLGHSGLNHTMGMKPGEARTVTVYRTEKNRTHEVLKTYTLTRTTRDYIYDLCDAYNATRSERMRQNGLWWNVMGGQLEIGTRHPNEPPPRKADEWKPAEGEMEAIRVDAARHASANPTVTCAEFNRMVRGVRYT